MGTRVPVASGLNSGPSSGLWLAVTDHDAALTAPGAAPTETYKMVISRESKTAAREARNYATMLDLFEWKFSGCCCTPGASSILR